MKIVIFSGGTGSRELQRGLFSVFGKKSSGLDYTVITNLYDNGLSTGTCRKVMDGKMLGPSDLRKNQLLRHQLTHGETPIYQFLSERTTLSFKETVQDVNRKIDELRARGIVCEEHFHVLKGAAEAFFSLPLASKVDYADFSVANILYSGLAKLNDYSLSRAGKIFARILRIPEDAVIPSSDENLYLTARTRSGKIIYDEGDIVNWNNPDDKIVDVELVDRFGKVGKARLTHDARQAISSAKLIIFAPGTQWSSLIPTYVATDFKEAITQSRAEKYLVINVAQDKDIKGVTGDELLLTLSRYIPLKVCNVVQSVNAAREMLVTESALSTEVKSLITEPISKKNALTHDPRETIQAIFFHFYRDALKNKTFVFDYDDTLVARGGERRDVSLQNLQLFVTLNNIPSVRAFIATGNTINAITGFNEFNARSGCEKPITVFAENGVNMYELEINSNLPPVERITLKTCLKPELCYTAAEVNDIIGALESAGFPINMIQNRSNAVIAIKPVLAEYSDICLNLIKQVISPSHKIRKTGRSTIEISKQSLCKAVIVDTILKNEKITMVGDEWECGNDSALFRHKNVTFVPVDDVHDTNVFLHVLLQFLNR